MKEMLQSVRRASPDIFLVSISYESPVTRNMVNDLASWAGPAVQWYIHDQPMRQFDHYLHIYLKEQSKDPEDMVVTFVDDDDLLHPERVTLGCQIPEGYDGTICKYSNDMTLVDQPVRQTSDTEYVYEYVCCALKWHVIDEIFSLRDDPLLSMINMDHPHCDWQFLECVTRRFEINYIDDILYLYRLRSK